MDQEAGTTLKLFLHLKALSNKTLIIFTLAILFEVTTIGSAAESNKTYSITNKIAHQVTTINRLVEGLKCLEALPIATTNLALVEHYYGTNSVNTAMALYWLAEIYQLLADYEKAEPLNFRCLAIMESVLGTNQPGTAKALEGLGDLFYKQSMFAKAESYYERCLMIRERTLGPEHPDTVMAMNSLAMLLRNTGDYVNAESLFELALKINEKVHGLEHLDTAIALNNLALLLKDVGDYVKAEQLFKRCLKIQENVLGPEHLGTAIALNNLALNHQIKGDYFKAEPLLERTLQIYEKVLGPEHPDTATVLNNLAYNSYSKGDYFKAEPLFERALRTQETVLGSAHTGTAITLNNLALNYQAKAEYQKAQPLFERALMVYEKVLGTEHPDVAMVLNNLALLYHDKGNLSITEPLFERALKIQEKSLGAEHPSTALTLNNLALHYQSKANHQKAESLFARALKIYEKILGPEHPSTARTLNNLAFFYLCVAHNLQTPISPKALFLAQKSKIADEKNLNQILLSSSESGRAAYQQTKNPYTILANLNNGPGLAETLLRNKSIVLDSLVEDEVVASSSQDPQIKIQLQELKDKGCQLVQMQAQIPQDISEKGCIRHRENLAKLEAKLENLQKAIARHVAASGQTRRALKITVGDIQNTLPPDTFILEIVQYDHYWGANACMPHYGAVLIGNKNSSFRDAKAGEPAWIPLGSAVEIENNLKTYVDNMRAVGRGEPNILRNLYNQLWEPIQKQLPSTLKTIIISPDAELNFLSFATLLGPDDRFLAERYAIRYVSTGRDLVYGKSISNNNSQLVSFANPAFGEDGGTANTAQTNGIQLAVSDLNRRDYSGLNLVPLPGTEREVNFLKTNASRWHISNQVYIGKKATETELRALHSPYILHLATHGFFLPAPVQKTNDAKEMMFQENARRPVVYKNPMQRSGLAFTGAQLTLDAWKRGETPNSTSDGILTALEAGTLDLKDTWLVVLSACDTGTGQAQAGEGVMGLRRGFMLAGAQNLMMTLWPISDKYAAMVMADFYEQAMQTKQAPDSLAQVQRKWLIKLREQYGVVMAARLAGPFVMTYQSSAQNHNN